jgi:hypothetical protein
LGGPSKQDFAQQSSIAQQQVAIGQEQNTLARENKQKMDKLLQPAIDFNTGVTTSKDTQMVAAAPVIGELSKAGKVSEEQIFESIPAGPARDMAIAENKRATAGGIAKARSDTYLSSIDKLANIGSGLGSFSLQELGAALTGFGSGASTGQSVIQGKAQKKAATTGMIGDFASAAGMAAGGHFAK